ncbi:hypothetical protein SELMODRAFT_122946, partial [Selaginella moellendorffii]
KSILCTQPRKVAAFALTRRVAKECHGCYEKINSIGTLLYRDQQDLAKMVYTMDHVLLQLYLSTRNLNWFSCIVVDEAHERSLSIDLLLAVLKECMRAWSDLRLIIMPATANAELFSDYFCIEHLSLRQEDQQLVFEAASAGTRKIVFATNITETSLTIMMIFLEPCS